jgi:sugar phosphate isomerase/epimerase
MMAVNLQSCAINTATLGFQCPIEQSIDAIAAQGFGGITPWRREIEGQNVSVIAKRIRDAGLDVTGYCRSTYLPSLAAEGLQANIESNRRALDDAAILGASSFVMVVGGLPMGSKDIAGARAQVVEGTTQLLEHGKKLGVRIALEPLHPVYTAERSCLTLLSEALELCQQIEGSVSEPSLGVCLDVYHVWWDPNLKRDIARAGMENRIFGFHVCDWLVPTNDVLNDRGMMGDGVIDIPSIRALVEKAGYQGLTEVEIFSVQNWWKRPVAEILRVCAERLATSV